MFACGAHNWLDFASSWIRFRDHCTKRTFLKLVTSSLRRRRDLADDDTHLVMISFFPGRTLLYSSLHTLALASRLSCSFRSSLSLLSNPLETRFRFVTKKNRCIHQRRQCRQSCGSTQQCFFNFWKKKFTVVLKIKPLAVVFSNAKLLKSTTGKKSVF